MSRIGKIPINIPDGVNVIIDGNKIIAKGPLGELKKTITKNVKIKNADGVISILPVNDDKNAIALWGTARSIVNNIVQGVSSLFKKELEIIGVGYKANIKGDYINLELGKSHNTKIYIPSIIKVEVIKQTNIILSSIDKQKLGQFAALLMHQRPVEPYKGKGIRIKGQCVIRKESKKSTK